MEKLFYEARPFIYIALAVFALANVSLSKFMPLYSLILIASALMIFKWRASERRTSKIRSY